MNVVFLDIDGVLNTEVYVLACHDAARRISNGTDMFMNAVRDGYGNHFDPLAIRALSEIINQTGSKIVISSSWRMSGLIVMKQMWLDRKLPGEVIDVTPCYRDKRREHLPFTERAERGNEIKHWLKLNTLVVNYLILDDDNDMLPEQSDNFIQTTPEYGLQVSHIQKAVKILTKNNG